MYALICQMSFHVRKKYVIYEGTYLSTTNKNKTIVFTNNCKRNLFIKKIIDIRDLWV